MIWKLYTSRICDRPEKHLMNVHRRSRHRPLPLASICYHVPFRQCLTTENWKPHRRDSRTLLMKVYSSNNERLVQVFLHILYLIEIHRSSKQISCLLLSLWDYSWGITVACQTPCKAEESRCYSVIFYLRLREGLEILKSYLRDRLLYKCASVHWI